MCPSALLCVDIALFVLASSFLYINYKHNVYIHILLEMHRYISQKKKHHYVHSISKFKY